MHVRITIYASSAKRLKFVVKWIFQYESVVQQKIDIFFLDVKSTVDISLLSETFLSYLLISEVKQYNMHKKLLLQ